MLFASVNPVSQRASIIYSISQPSSDSQAAFWAQAHWHHPWFICTVRTTRGLFILHSCNSKFWVGGLTCSQLWWKLGKICFNEYLCTKRYHSHVGECWLMDSVHSIEQKGSKKKQISTSALVFWMASHLPCREDHRDHPTFPLAGFLPVYLAQPLNSYIHAIPSLKY